MVRTCGICGGSGAGKTTLTRLLMTELGAETVSVLAFDSYYRDQAHLSINERSEINYDHPDALDHERFAADVAALQAGKDIEIPVYDFATHTRTGETRLVEAKPIVIVEGILLLSFSEVVDHLDVAVFLDIDEPVRRERRIARDVAERGRTAAQAAEQFEATVAPMHDQFVQPFRDRAHRLVTVDEDLSTVAAELAATLRSP